MDKNTMIGLGVIVLIIVGFLIWGNTSSRDRDTDRDADEEETATTSEDDATGDDLLPEASNETRTAMNPQGSAQASGATSVASGASMSVPASSNLPAMATVRYTASGFVPQAVTIARGGTVTFVNETESDMKVESTTSYPGFDSSELSEDESYKFPFLSSGTWVFRSSSSASDTVSIVVGN